MLEFHQRRSPAGRTLALFPGAFNPPTVAHLAMAEAALALTDEVVFVLPKAFPHKPYEGPGFSDRLNLLIQATARRDEFSVASAEQGLFIDIARAARAAGERQPRIFVVCGADAAQRIVEWDYGEREPISRQLEEYELLVAPRRITYVPPVALTGRIHLLELASQYQEISATEIRRRVAQGADWRSWVPEEVALLVERLYS